MYRLTGLVCMAVALSLAPGFVPWAAADAGQSVRTQSGKMRCYVHSDYEYRGVGGPLVVCQTSGPEAKGFPQAPASATPGFHYNMAVARGSGSLSWDEGNIPGSEEAMAQDIVMTYGQTYHINGWTILPTFEGTRFTNDTTGHGMFVSVDNVYSF